MKKQFFWLKIQTKFFSDLKIKKLLKSENGAEKVFLYMRMMLLSLESDGVIVFQHVENTFEEEMALQLDVDENFVKETLQYLINQDLVKVDNEEYVFLQIGELTGVESESTSRVRRHRAEKKTSEEKCNADVTQCNAEENKCNADVTSCNVNVTPCNADVTKNVTTEKEIDKEKDKEIDLEKEIDKDLEKASVTCLNTKFKKTYDKNLSTISKLYEKNMGPIYPNITSWLLDTAQKFEVGLFEKAIAICREKNQMNVGYLRGIFRCWENEKIFEIKDLQQNKTVYFDDAICEEDEIDEAMLLEMKELEEKLGVL